MTVKGTRLATDFWFFETARVRPHRELFRADERVSLPSFSLDRARSIEPLIGENTAKRESSRLYGGCNRGCSVDGIYPSGTNLVAKDRKSKWRILAPVDAYIRAEVTCHRGRGHVTSWPIGARARARARAVINCKYDRCCSRRATLRINARPYVSRVFLFFLHISSRVICLFSEIKVQIKLATPARHQNRMCLFSEIEAVFLWFLYPKYYLQLSRKCRSRHYLSV